MSFLDHLQSTRIEKKKKNGTLGTVSIRLKKVHMVMRWRSGCLNASSSSKIFPSFSSEQQCCSSFKHKLTASGIFSSSSQPYHPLYISTIHPRRRPSCSSSILLFLLLQGLITLLSKANIFLHNCLEFLSCIPNENDAHSIYFCLWYQKGL